MLHARTNHIADGDLVIVYVSHDEMKAVKVSTAGKTHVRYGIFEHQDWIGRAYGTKVFSKSGSWVYLLAPTPELWTQVLSHRTQILYIADCARICAVMGLRSGKVVRF
jgi:tRNA (adenine57-N1/adenine58-N1)-methyltransferase catalytic subunit